MSHSGEEITPCNTPGQEDSKNCPQVLHVKRPRYPDGTPALSDWGVAIWHKPCDEDCDGDIYDEGELDQDGEFIRKLEDMGPITFELGTDVYDEVTNEPIGKYKSGCCCPLYLIVVHCGGNGSYGGCINLSDICPDQIPEWNPEIGEVLVLRGKEGTDAEGFCGYSAYNFNLDGSQNYDLCGRPVYEWVLNNGCKLGAGSIGECSQTTGNIFHNGQVVKFCDLNIEVFQVPDPSWVEGSNSRLCKYACESCYAIYEQCHYCDGNHPSYPMGKCINSHYCEFEEGGVNDDNFQTTPLYPVDSPCRDIVGIDRDCMRRNEIITSQEFALNNYYWNMTPCETNATYSDDPCGECNWLLLRQCNCTNCSDNWSEDECPQWVYTYDYVEHWNERTHVKVVFDFTHDTSSGPTVNQIGGCYENMGIKTLEELPEGAVFSDFIISNACYSNPDGVMECRPTDSCEMFAPCCGSTGPSITQFDCCSWCPEWACENEYQPGVSGTCLTCCDCKDPACVTHPGGNPCDDDCDGYGWGGHFNGVEENETRDVSIKPSNVNFNSLELYPDEIKVVIPIDLPTITTEIPVSFVVGSPPPIVRNPTPVNIESYNAMQPHRYVPTFVTQSLGDTIKTGSFADLRNEMPQVNDGNYLGNYTDGNSEWSAWLTLTDCHGINSIVNNIRYFSFTYTVFAYCQEGKCKQDSKVIEKKVVGFYMDARIGTRS